ncbi:MAG: DUF1707 domain-containing protein [Dermatophilaceae bacterium]
MARRVGNTERDEAIALLDEQWQAGRLDPGEHELRVARAKAAGREGQGSGDPD